MKSLKLHWEQLAARFAALTRRERLIVSIALFAGGGFLLFSLVIEPGLIQARQSLRAETLAKNELTQLQTQVFLLARQSADIDAPSRRRLDQLRVELTSVDSRLAAIESRMVPPARMRAFLEGVLARNGAVELIGFRTLPVSQVGVAQQVPRAEPPPPTLEQVARNPAAAAVAPAPAPAIPAQVAAGEGSGVFKHGIEIRLAGNYNDLVAYMAELERLPERVMWNSVSLSVERYPRNILIVRVYTLSLDKNWMTV